MPILDIRNLNIRYFTNDREVLACDGVDLQVDEQDSIGIVGESGSGKSTLAMGVLGLLPENSTRLDGDILFKGRNIAELSQSELAAIRWKEMAAVFQKSMNSLSPVHKIGNQIAGIYRIHRPKADKKECRELAKALFDKVNLSMRVYDLYPHQLSGGMMQRVTIALSLMFNPSLVILDEATTALDVVSEGQILREIVHLQETDQVTYILITHNMGVVASSCKKVAVMYAGRIMEYGLAIDILRHPVHPYTQGLLRSFPSFTGEKGSLRGIPGSLPDLSESIEGCAFASRCPRATERCGMERPPVVEVKEGWSAACFYAEEGGEL